MRRASKYALIVAACCLIQFLPHGNGSLSVSAAPEFVLQFDGIDDRVTFGAAPELGASRFTVELWFMRTGAGLATTTGGSGITAVPLVTKGRGEADGSNRDMNYFLGIDSTRRVLAADFEDMATGLNHPVAGRTAICDGIWYHAAATYDGTTWRLYLNGELDAELVVGTAGQFTPRWDSIQHAALGSAITSSLTVPPAAAAGFFRGRIDEARIWNVARSQTDIQDTMGEALFASQANLIGRWGLDEGSGTVAGNSAGIPNGTLAPGSPMTPPAWIAGGSGFATTLVPGADVLRLNAPGGDYVSFGAATSTLGASRFTIETWFNRSAAGMTTTTGAITAVPLVTKGRGEGDNTNVDMNYFLGIDATNVLAADFEDAPNGAIAGGANHPIKGMTPIASGVWTHAAVTYDGTNLQLYLNGVPDGPPVFAGTMPRADSIQHAALGSALNSTGLPAGFFFGSLDETRIWNYARSAAQIAAAANREIPVAPGLLARWSFNECCGRVVDSTGHIPFGPPAVVVTPPAAIVSATLVGSGWSWAPRADATFATEINLAPVVDAGPDTAVTLPAGGTLAGAAMDNDGVNTGAPLSFAWSKTSGPGIVVFGNPTSLSTGVTFSATGTYVLTLTATDGEASGTDSVTVVATGVADPSLSPSFALDFSGINGYVGLGPAPRLGASTFTLEAWIKREGTGVPTSTGSLGVAAAVPLVTKGRAEADGTNLDMNYFLGIDGATNVLVADFEEGSGGASPGLNHPIFGVTAIQTNVWNHVAATYDGSKWQLFLNGNLERELIVSRPVRADSIQHAAIGSALNSTGVAAGFFDGVMDEVRIWGVARTQQQIQEGMTGEVLSAPSLLGRWGLNAGTGGAGTLIADSSGQDVNGVINGVFAWVPGVTFPTLNHAPDAPIVNAPAAGATDVDSPVTLDVSVSDADVDPLTVRYFGRRKGVAAPDFTFLTIPDTQHYSDSATRAPTFTAQTNWIVANRERLNIAFTSHLGDIVENQDAVPVEWERANASMSVLDLNGVPYGVSPGNHDQNPAGVAALFDQFFPPSRFLGNSWYGGYLGSDPTDPIDRLNKDNYELFSAGGRDFLIIHIEHDWPGYAVTWADRIIKANPNRLVILSTHLFLNTSNARPTTAPFRGANGTSAEAVWQQIIKPNCNVFMVVNGHYPGEGRRVDLNDCGQPVHQVLMDYQSRANGGDGWLRYFTFKPSENKIYAYTYSPTLNQFEVDADSQFVLDYNLQAPFELIATNTGVASGSSTTAAWSGLATDTEYEWYVTINDGRSTTTGPVSSFTTAPPPNVAPAAVDDSYAVPEDGVLDVPAPGVLGNDSDSDGGTLHPVLVSGPAHGTLDLNADGRVIYRPAPDYNGPDSFSYKANDDEADSNVATVTIAVTAVNDAPVAIDDAASTPEETAVSGNVLGNDTDVDAGTTLTASLGASPVNGTVTLASDGSFSYSPNADFNGTDSFSYTTSDGAAVSNVATVTVTVTGVNDAPVAIDDAASTEEETAVSGNVLGNDTDIDAETTLTAGLGAGPSNGTVTLASDGSFNYSPNANFNGTDTFTYTASDGAAVSNAATVTITVAGVNDVPVAVNDAASTQEETAVSGNVLGNDTDVDTGTTLTASLDASPSNGTLTFNADGSFTYTPAAEFSGTDSFRYKASDGTADSNVATVTIVVDAVNDEPVAASDSFSTIEDQVLSVAAPGVLGNDTDVDGGALRAVLVSGPSHGALTLNSDGSFNYLPAANFAGADSFSYHANDGSGDSSPVIVSIVVNAVNDAPAANNQSVTTQENRAVSITLQAQDAEGDSLTYRIVSGPANGTLTGVAPNMTYTPRNNFIGADSFTFVANDGVADSNVATVGITVTSPANQPPVANSQSVQTDEDTRVRIMLTAQDAEGKSLKFLVVSGPQHGRLTGHAPNLRYRPDSDYNGPDSFTFKVSDGTSESNIATVTITVRPVNDAPRAEDVVVRRAGSGAVSGLMRATDADGDTLRFRVVGEPVRGTVTVDAATGGFVYTPPPGAKRTDVRFSYVANDGTIDSSRATVRIE